MSMASAAKKRPSVAHIPGTPSMRKRYVADSSDAWTQRQMTYLTCWINYELASPTRNKMGFALSGIGTNPSFLETTAAMKEVRDTMVRHGLTKVSGEMKKGFFFVTRSINLEKFLKERDQLISLLLLNYHPTWLLLALCVVLGENFGEDVSTAFEAAKKETGIVDRDRVFMHVLEDILKNQFLNVAPFPERSTAFTRKSDSPLSRRRAEYNSIVLHRVLSLVLLLDCSKLKRSVWSQLDAPLFRHDSEMISSRDVLDEFGKLFLHEQADLFNYLRHRGYHLSYEAPIIEHGRRLTVNNIETDMKDGEVLCKLAAILTKDDMLLSHINRGKQAQREGKMKTQIHNITMALYAMSRFANDRIGGKWEWRAKSEEIAKGYLHKTLELLWQIVALWIQTSVLDHRSVAEELEVVRDQFREAKKGNTISYSSLETVSEEISPYQNSPSKLSVYEDCDNATMDCLLLWVATISAIYGVPVKDYTESFRDGSALCLILHHYYPEVVRLDSFIRVAAAELRSKKDSERETKAVTQNFELFMSTCLSLGHLPHIPLSVEAALAPSFVSEQKAKSYGRLITILVSYLFRRVVLHKADDIEAGISRNQLYRGPDITADPNVANAPVTPSQPSTANSPSEKAFSETPRNISGSRSAALLVTGNVEEMSRSAGGRTSVEIPAPLTSRGDNNMCLLDNNEAADVCRDASGSTGNIGIDEALASPDDYETDHDQPQSEVAANICESDVDKRQKAASTIWGSYQSYKARTDFLRRKEAAQKIQSAFRALEGRRERVEVEQGWEIAAAAIKDPALSDESIPSPKTDLLENSSFLNPLHAIAENMRKIEQGLVDDETALTIGEKTVEQTSNLMMAFRDHMRCLDQYEHDMTLNEKTTAAHVLQNSFRNHATEVPSCTRLPEQPQMVNVPPSVVEKSYGSAALNALGTVSGIVAKGAASLMKSNGVIAQKALLDAEEAFQNDEQGGRFAMRNHTPQHDANRPGNSVGLRSTAASISGSGFDISRNSEDRPSPSGTSGNESPQTSPSQSPVFLPDLRSPVLLSKLESSVDSSPPQSPAVAMSNAINAAEIALFDQIKDPKNPPSEVPISPELNYDADAEVAGIMREFEASTTLNQEPEYTEEALDELETSIGLIGCDTSRSQVRTKLEPECSASLCLPEKSSISSVLESAQDRGEVLNDSNSRDIPEITAPGEALQNRDCTPRDKRSDPTARSGVDETEDEDFFSPTEGAEFFSPRDHVEESFFSPMDVLLEENSVPSRCFQVEYPLRTNQVAQRDVFFSPNSGIDGDVFFSPRGTDGADNGRGVEMETPDATPDTIEEIVSVRGRKQVEVDVSPSADVVYSEEDFHSANEVESEDEDSDFDDDVVSSAADLFNNFMDDLFEEREFSREKRELQGEKIAANLLAIDEELTQLCSSFNYELSIINAAEQRLDSTSRALEHFAAQQFDDACAMATQSDVLCAVDAAQKSALQSDTVWNGIAQDYEQDYWAYLESCAAFDEFKSRAVGDDQKINERIVILEQREREEEQQNRLWKLLSNAMCAYEEKMNDLQACAENAVYMREGCVKGALEAEQELKEGEQEYLSEIRTLDTQFAAVGKVRDDLQDCLDCLAANTERFTPRKQVAFSFMISDNRPTAEELALIEEERMAEELIQSLVQEKREVVEFDDLEFQDTRTVSSAPREEVATVLMIPSPPKGMAILESSPPCTPVPPEGGRHNHIDLFIHPTDEADGSASHTVTEDICVAIPREARRRTPEAAPVSAEKEDLLIYNPRTPDAGSMHSYQPESSISERDPDGLDTLANLALEQALDRDVRDMEMKTDEEGRRRISAAAASSNLDERAMGELVFDADVDANVDSPPRDNSSSEECHDLRELSMELGDMQVGQSPESMHRVLENPTSAERLHSVMRRISIATASPCMPESSARTHSYEEENSNVVGSIIRSVFVVMSHCSRTKQQARLTAMGMSIIRDICQVQNRVQDVIDVHDSIDIISTVIQFYRDHGAIFSCSVQVLWCVAMSEAGQYKMRDDTVACKRLRRVNELLSFQSARERKNRERIRNAQLLQRVIKQRREGGRKTCLRDDLERARRVMGGFDMQPKDGHVLLGEVLEIVSEHDH